MMGFAVFLTYVAEVAGVLGVIAALVGLVLSSPESDTRRTTTTSDAETTTYWVGAEPISRAEYDHLTRRP